MHYRRLGDSGLTVSRLCLGTMTFGLQIEAPESFNILDKALAGGITFVDTANVYPLGGDLTSAGRTEEIVGRWLKGKRDKIVLATKAVGKMGPNSWDQGASRKHLLDAIDASLRRLNTEYVDLYQLHSDDPQTPLDETLEALDTMVRSGKVRYIGVSNFLSYRLARALGRSDLRGLARFVSVQPRYNLLFRQIERELLPLASEEHIGVIPYNPLAGGLLTGKHRHDAKPADGRFMLGTAGKTYQDRYWHAGEFETVQKLGELLKEVPASMATVAIAWVLANPVITSAIIGASRADQLDDSLAAAAFVLDPALKAKMDDATRQYRLGDATR
jgi:aryl-alcohol dehydrogenase-like predicted oxidoreductase